MTHKWKIGQDDVGSSYTVFFLVKNEIIYLMQRNGLVYTYIHLWIKEIIT